MMVPALGDIILQSRRTVVPVEMVKHTYIRMYICMYILQDIINQGYKKY